MKTSFLFLFIFILFGCKSESERFINTTDGIAMYYKSFGSKKPTLIFVHGWSCDASAWDDQTNYFKDKYQVIALDLPGFGRSGKLRDQWNIQRLGLDIVDLSLELDLNNIILIGHSLGGPVVLEAAKELKEKVKGVILVDILQTPHYSYDSTSVINFYNNYAENYKNFKSNYEYFRQDSLNANRYINMLPKGEVPPEPWLPIIKDLFRWMSHDLKTIITEIQIPIRALNADLYETNFEEWNLLYNNFNATIIENSGHYLNWEYPDKFNHSLHALIQDILK